MLPYIVATLPELRNIKIQKKHQSLLYLHTRYHPIKKITPTFLAAFTPFPIFSNQ